MGQLIADLDATPGLTAGHIIELEDPVAGTSEKSTLTQLAAFLAGLGNVFQFIGGIDCSANPNYPAADCGHVYKISVAGKIGGASGPDVEVGDTLYCTVDSTAAGTHAAVGANWIIQQANETVINAGNLIASASAKATPVDADVIGLSDSADSNTLKKLSWANIKATLKTYFDTLYATVAQPFDIHTFFPGIPTASAKLYRGKLARAVTFPANFAGAQFTATANAAASTVFDIQKNGVSVGTCTIAIGTTTPTFASTGGLAVAYAAGDIFGCFAPLVPDATLADPAITFAGTR